MKISEISTSRISESLKAFRVRNGLRFVQDSNVETISNEVQKLLGDTDQQTLKEAFNAYTRAEIETSGKYLCTRMVSEILNEYKSLARANNRERQNRYEDNRLKDWQASEHEKAQIMLDGFVGQYMAYKSWMDQGAHKEEMPPAVGLYTLHDFLLGNDILREHFVNWIQSGTEGYKFILEAHRYKELKVRGTLTPYKLSKDDAIKAARVLGIFEVMRKSQEDEDKILRKLRRSIKRG